MSEPISISDLPEHILPQVLRHLKAEDLAALSVQCKFLRQECEVDVRWREICIQKWHDAKLDGPYTTWAAYFRSRRVLGFALWQCVHEVLRFLENNDLPSNPKPQDGARLFKSFFKEILCLDLLCNAGNSSMLLHRQDIQFVEEQILVWLERNLEGLQGYTTWYCELLWGAKRAAHQMLAADVNLGLRPLRWLRTMLSRSLERDNTEVGKLQRHPASLAAKQKILIAMTKAVKKLEDSLAGSLQAWV